MLIPKDQLVFTGHIVSNFPFLFHFCCFLSTGKVGMVIICVTISIHVIVIVFFLMLAGGYRVIVG